MTVDGAESSLLKPEVFHDEGMSCYSHSPRHRYEHTPQVRHIEQRWHSIVEIKMHALQSITIEVLRVW